MTTQVAQDLRAAAEVIKRDGWTRGEYRDSTGRCCVMGAVETAVGHYWARHNAAHFALRTHLGNNPVVWNDVYCADQDQAVAALEAAAAEAESGNV